MQYTTVSFYNGFIYMVGISVGLPMPQSPPYSILLQMNTGLLVTKFRHCSVYVNKLYNNNNNIINNNNITKMDRLLNRGLHLPCAALFCLLLCDVEL